MSGLSQNISMSSTSPLRTMYFLSTRAPVHPSSSSFRSVRFCFLVLRGLCSPVCVILCLWVTYSYCWSGDVWVLRLDFCVALAMGVVFVFVWVASLGNTVILAFCGLVLGCSNVWNVSRKGWSIYGVWAISGRSLR